MSRLVTVILLLFSTFGFAEENTVKLKQLNLSDAMLVLEDGKEFSLESGLRKHLYAEGGSKLAKSLEGKYVTITWELDKSSDFGRSVTKIKPVLGNNAYGRHE